MNKLQLACKLIERPFSLLYLEYFAFVAICSGDLLYLAFLFGNTGRYLTAIFVVSIFPVLCILFALARKIREYNRRNISGFGVALVYCGMLISLFHGKFAQTIICGCVLMIILLILDSVLGKKAYLDPVTIYYKNYYTYKSIAWSEISVITVDRFAECLRITPMGLHSPDNIITIPNGGGEANKMIWEILGRLNYRFIQHEITVYGEPSMIFLLDHNVSTDILLDQRETQASMLTKDCLRECLGTNIKCLWQASLWGLFISCLIFFLVESITAVEGLWAFVCIFLGIVFLALAFINIHRIIKFLTAPKEKEHFIFATRYKLLALLLMIPGVVMAWFGPTGILTPQLHWTISFALIIVPLFALIFLSRKVILTSDGICSQSLVGRTELTWSEIERAEMRFAYRSSLVLEGNGKTLEVSAWLKDWHLLVGEIVSHLPFQPQWHKDLVSHPEEIREIQETPNIP